MSDEKKPYTKSCPRCKGTGREVVQTMVVDKEGNTRVSKVHYSCGGCGGAGVVIAGYR